MNGMVHSEDSSLHSFYNPYLQLFCHQARALLPLASNLTLRKLPNQEHGHVLSLLDEWFPLSPDVEDILVVMIAHILVILFAQVKCLTNSSQVSHSKIWHATFIIIFLVLHTHEPLPSLWSSERGESIFLELMHLQNGRGNCKRVSH